MNLLRWFSLLLVLWVALDAGVCVAQQAVPPASPGRIGEAVGLK